MFKNVQEIKKAVDEGKKVYWLFLNYEVIKDSIDQYLIHSKFNDHYIGLTHRDGTTLNGKPEEFFME
jgi:hypothetical protein